MVYIFLHNILKSAFGSVLIAVERQCQEPKGESDFATCWCSYKASPQGGTP